MNTEDFWAGEFGTEYSMRCFEDEHSIAKVAMWADILRHTQGVHTAIELGCNTGGNLKALEMLLPGYQHLVGVEINEWAAHQAQQNTSADIVLGSMFDVERPPCVLSFTCGVLIHTPPDRLGAAYQKLYDLSSRYILVCEYYSPRPEEIPYRGHGGRLWKRDFAGEMIQEYGLRLVAYRFVYRLGPFPQDDMTWFLMEK